MTDAEFLSTDFAILQAVMSVDEINRRLDTIQRSLTEQSEADERLLRSLIRTKRTTAAIRCLSCLPDEAFDGWNPPDATHCLRCYMPLSKKNQRTSKAPERLGEILARARGFR